jgi:hypothetical protein
MVLQLFGLDSSTSKEEAQSLITAMVRTQTRSVSFHIYKPLADLNIATSGNRNLVCDLAGDWTQACYTTLLIRISSMERITEVRGMALDWTVCHSATPRMLCVNSMLYVLGRSSGSWCILCLRAIFGLDSLGPSIIL